MPFVGGFHAIRHTLGQPNYGVYVAGNAVSLIGLWMHRIGVGWLTWELTGSGAALGLVAFADLFPSVFIGPFAGALADRVSRLRVIAVAQSVAAVQAVALCALVALQVITVEWLIALTLANGIALGFNQPSRLALVSSLVPRDQLATAVAINSTVFNLARFIGPALAGGLILSAGVSWVFAANALSYVAFLMALSRIRLDPAEEARPARPGVSLIADVGEGIKYTVNHPGIGPVLLLLVATAVGVRPFVELLPGFAADVFHRGADALAMLSATVGLGAIASGVWLAQRGPRAGLTQLVLGSTLSVALAMIGFVATDHFGFALFSVAVAGSALVVGGVGGQTLLQLTVEPAMRGRVLSLYGIIFRGGPAAGALLMGTASEWVGLRWPLAFGAGLAIAAWAWAWRRRARIAAVLETDEGPRPPA